MWQCFSTDGWPSILPALSYLRSIQMTWSLGFGCMFSAEHPETAPTKNREEMQTLKWHLIFCWYQLGSFSCIISASLLAVAVMRLIKQSWPAGQDCCQQDWSKTTIHPHICLHRRPTLCFLDEKGAGSTSVESNQKSPDLCFAPHKRYFFRHWPTTSLANSASYVHFVTSKWKASKRAFNRMRWSTWRPGWSIVLHLHAFIIWIQGV